MIYTQKLTKQYGDVRALNEVSLKIRDGEFVALLGPNGSGKSTLFRSLLGIQEYDGLIRIDGCDPLQQGKEVRRKIGYMPQHSGLHGELTIEETINFYCRVKRSDPAHAAALLDKVQLSGKLTSRVSELSGGMRQRLAFAVALLADPEILLLDEPTASLDSRSQALILEWLMQLHTEGKTILISTHSKQDIMSLAIRAITLEEGEIASDRELLTNGQSLIIKTQEQIVKTSKEAAVCCAI